MLLTRPRLDIWDPNNFFTLQWHLTSRCEGNCRFCYMLDSPNYENELANELTINQCLKLVDDYIFYLKKNGLLGFVNLTGGDPLLKEGFWNILENLEKRGIGVGILGNPHLVNAQTAQKLADLKISHYQLSIDGTKKTHDYFRGAGSFERTWNAARILSDYGVPITISTTVSRKNFRELDAIIDLCFNNDINAFRPTRLVPEGKGKSWEQDILTPTEYKETLFKVINKISARGLSAGRYLRIPLCDKLTIPLILSEEGNSVPLFIRSMLSARTGCRGKFLTVLPDGKIFVCRRLPVEVGNVLEDSFEQALNSKLATDLRNPRSFKECSACDYAVLCAGGCPAVTNALTGDPLGKDPQCWVDARGRKSKKLFVDSPVSPAVALDDLRQAGKSEDDNIQSKLFQPFKIGSLTLPNRIFRSATLERAALPDGSPTEEHLKLYRELVEGGCGLIITGIAYVSENGKINGGQNGIHEDWLIDRWREVTQETHRRGGKIAMQLTHQSLVDPPFEGELMGPSSRRYLGKLGSYVYSREMTELEIWRVIDEFVQAILRVETAGFDAVQLQLAHGYLLWQFLSPAINTRRDSWGGTFENRLRIIREIINEARIKLKNKDFPIMVKMDSSNGIRDQVGLDEAAEIVSQLAAGGVAAFELSGQDAGKIGRESCGGDNECYFQKPGEFIRKKNPEVVLGICGGIRSRGKMEELINKGFNFVALSRPLIREPGLAEKMRSNPDYQTECVSCGMCFIRIKNRPLRCYLKM
jgi:radical SAM protein with 4Fe4S-binding SPASM domain